MKWRDAKRSSNVEDRRGARGVGRAAVGGGGMIAVVAIVVGLFFPQFAPFLKILTGAIDGGGGGGFSGGGSQSAPINDDHNAFVSSVLAYTENTWGRVFESGAFPEAGRTYQEPTLVLFSGQTATRCGMASSASGPFYCPADEKIYIDPAFYEVMSRQLRAKGDFAQAYVIAHEVAHHVQNEIGVLPKVNQLRARSNELQGNRLTVRLELQADCLAGVWARDLNARFDALEAGDLQEAVTAAHQVGDDVLQRMSGGQVDESKFTHGSAEQRVRWFKAGFEAGAPNVCDTFRPSYDAL